MLVKIFLANVFTSPTIRLIVHFAGYFKQGISTMFSQLLDSGVQVTVRITPNNSVVIDIDNNQRSYELDITRTGYGQSILSNRILGTQCEPWDATRDVAEMAEIGKWFQGVNDHWVEVAPGGGGYIVACPFTPGFISKAVSLRGTLEERSAVKTVCCRQCGAEATIPLHALAAYKAAQTMKPPKWKFREDGEEPLAASATA
jgi:hypothetical protein